MSIKEKRSNHVFIWIQILVYYNQVKNSKCFILNYEGNIITVINSELCFNRLVLNIKYMYKLMNQNQGTKSHQQKIKLKNLSCKIEIHLRHAHYAFFYNVV